MPIPHTRIKSISTTHTITKSISSLHWNQVQFEPPHCLQVNFDHPRKHQVNLHALTLNTCDLGSRTEMKSISTHLHNNQIVFIPTLKSSKVRSPALKSSQFWPSPHKTMSISVLTLKQGVFGPDTKTKHFDPRTKNKSISIPTLKPSNFLPPIQKPSWFRPQHWSQLNSDTQSK